MKTVTISDSDVATLVRIKRQRAKWDRIRKRLTANRRERNVSNQLDTSSPIKPKEIEMEAVYAAPPHEGWQLIARKQLSVGSHLYPRGSEVPVKALGRNVEALISTGHVKWAPPIAGRPASHELPPPVAAPKRPKLEIIADDDPVISYRKTKARLVELLSGDVGKADDILMSDPTARELYKLAVKEAATRKREELSSKQRGLISINVNELGL